jgi:hypothetical protein
MTAAEWATTLSFPVAALTFFLTAITRFKNERRLKIIQWQRVVVYGIVEQFGQTIRFPEGRKREIHNRKAISAIRAEKGNRDFVGGIQCSGPQNGAAR